MAKDWYVTTFPYMLGDEEKTAFLRYSSALNPFFKQCMKVNMEQSELEETVRYKRRLNDTDTMDR